MELMRHSGVWSWPVEEGDDGCCDRRTLRIETNELEDDAGADGADGIVALEIGDEWGEDGVGRLGAEASENVGCGAAYVGVVVGEVGGDAGDLGFEERQGVAAEGVVGIGAALDGDDAVEGECADGGILVIDRLHDVGKNLFYVGERRFAESFGKVEDRVEGGGAVAGVGAVDAVLQQCQRRRGWRLRVGLAEESPRAIRRKDARQPEWLDSERRACLST